MSFKVFSDSFPDSNGKDMTFPRHPYRSIFAGASGCGKTNLLLNIILDKRSPFKIIYFYYKVWQKKYDILIDAFENKKRLKDKAIIFVEGFPDEKLFKSLEENKDTPKLVVLDDLMSESKHSKILSDLFTRGSHHLNTSVIVLHQSIFNDIILRLNTEYMFLWSFPANQQNARIFFQQVEPLNWKEIFKTYEECVSKPHQWFMMDLKCQNLGLPQMKYRCNSLEDVYIPENKS